MKVALLTGPCAVGQCGVGDYTRCLCDALKAIGVDAEVITGGDWRLAGVLGTRKLLREGGFDILHIQYPTAGFGTHIGIQAFSLLERCVVTVHEVSQRRIPRKLALFPFSVRPRHLIFTSRFEQRFAETWAPWIAGSTSTIPLGSAIPAATQNGARSTSEIVNFGLIMPEKGLEQVLELAALVRMSALPFEIHIVGQVPAKCTDYFKSLQLKAAHLPVFWHQGLDENEVAQRLAHAQLAYLPFPDGASERRTSLKGALLNGLAVITTKGPHTPTSLNDVVKFCRSPEEALTVIRELLEDQQQMSEMSKNSVKYGRLFSWERIAQLHLQVYNSVRN